MQKKDGRLKFGGRQWRWTLNSNHFLLKMLCARIQLAAFDSSDAIIVDVRCFLQSAESPGNDSTIHMARHCRVSH